LNLGLVAQGLGPLFKGGGDKTRKVQDLAKPSASAQSFGSLPDGTAVEGGQVKDVTPLSTSVNCFGKKTKNASTYLLNIENTDKGWIETDSINLYKKIL